MTYLVEVRYSGDDWPDLMADVGSSGSTADGSTLENIIIPRLVAALPFGSARSSENQAAAWEEAFGGRLQSAECTRTAGTGPWRTPRSAGGEANPSISTLSPTHSALLDHPPPKAGNPRQKRPRLGSPLMITRQQKANLRDGGDSDEQIRDMKPEEAHKMLGLID